MVILENTENNKQHRPSVSSLQLTGSSRPVANSILLMTRTMATNSLSTYTARSLWPGRNPSDLHQRLRSPSLNACSLESTLSPYNSLYILGDSVSKIYT
jgi:hypothetical protein